jgi:hypothetical protein
MGCNKCAQKRKMREEAARKAKEKEEQILTSLEGKETVTVVFQPNHTRRVQVVGSNNHAYGYFSRGDILQVSYEDYERYYFFRIAEKQLEFENEKDISEILDELSKLDGIGETRAVALSEKNIKSLTDVIKVGAEFLAENFDFLSKKSAERLIENARELLIRHT